MLTNELGSLKVVRLDLTVADCKHNHQKYQHQLVHHPLLVNGKYEV